MPGMCVYEIDDGLFSFFCRRELESPRARGSVWKSRGASGSEGFTSACRLTLPEATRVPVSRPQSSSHVSPFHA